MCLHAATRVQLFTSADNGWPHNALWYHQLMPISYHFRDCKSQQHVFIVQQCYIKYCTNSANSCRPYGIWPLTSNEMCDQNLSCTIYLLSISPVVFVLECWRIQIHTHTHMCRADKCPMPATSEWVNTMQTKTPKQSNTNSTNTTPTRWSLCKWNRMLVGEKM